MYDSRARSHQRSSSPPPSPSPTDHRSIALDIENLRVISKWLANAKGFHHIEKTLREWASEVVKELDFRREGGIQQEIRANLAAATDRDVAAVGVPAIIPGMQTKRVLAMMYVEGVKVTDLGALRRMGADPEKIVAQLTAAHAHQVFVNGLFHGDPHAGNILVAHSTLEGGEPHAMLLDFGCVKRMENDSVRLGFARMVVAANQLDAFMTVLMKKGMTGKGILGAARDISGEGFFKQGPLKSLIEKHAGKRASVDRPIHL